MKKLVLLLVLASVGLSSCYHAHVCPTYTNNDVEEIVIDTTKEDNL
jgi:hypothetical protein